VGTRIPDEERDVKREWKPGDVAICTIEGAVVVRTDSGTWHHPGYDSAQGLNDKDLRPLVVIDPEDRASVERLVHNYVAAANAATPPYGVGKVDTEAVATEMQAALREFANPTPPKPEEPTGLGAVVEAAAYTDEVRPFVRCPSDASPWTDDGGNGHAWSELDVVRVLSEGVPT
jgi:hypothetical protein